MSNSDKLWDFIAGIAEDYISDKSKVSDLRGRFAQIMSENRWRNRAFDNFVSDALNALDNMERMYKRSGDREEDWITDGVKAMVDGAFAHSVLSDDRASRSLSDREYDGMKQAQEEYAELMSRGGRDRHRRDDRRDLGQDRAIQSMGARDIGRSSRGVPPPGRGRDERNSSQAELGAWDIIANIGESTDDRRHSPEPTVREEAYIPPRPDDVIEPRQAVRPAVISLASFDGPDYTQPRPYDRFMRDGEQWVVVSQSTWELTGDGTIESTIPKLYNCNKYIKYHVMDDHGNVREEFQPVSEDNRYLAHENLNRAVEEPVAPKAASSGFSRAVLEGSDSGISEEFIPNQQVQLTELVREIDEDQFQLKQSSPVDSLNAATFSSRAMLRINNDVARVDLHLVRTPIVASKPGQINLIEQVYNTNSLADAQLKLNELKPQFDLPIWNTLNQRFSDYLLRASTYQFQFNEVLKMNFSKHYTNLLDVLKEQRGAEVAAQFAQRVGYVCDLATGHFAEADVESYTSDLFTGEEGKHIPIVAFVDFVAMVSFDCTLDQLGIGNQLDDLPMGSVVTSTSNRELNSTLRSMYEKLDKALPNPAKVRVYLSTSDNRLIEVLPFANRPDVFVLAAV